MVFGLFFTDGTGILLEKVIYVTIIIFTASLIAKTIATVISRFGKQSGLPENITRWINKIITYFIGFVGLVLILDLFEFNITSFVASFGIVGLIIGLSSQAVISNFIAGILVMLEKPFYRGDVIDIAGFQGRVEDISIRSTRVKTLDGRLITVPNSTFTTSSVINYSKTGRIQIRIPLSLPLDADLQKVSEIMISAAKNVREIRPFHIEALVTGITLTGLQKNVGIELRFWIDRFIEKDKIVSKVINEMKDELVKENISVSS